MIIAIDGASGTGKSSAAKCLATRLGFLHIDTGAMYRAFAYWCAYLGDDVNKALEQFDYTVKEVKGDKQYWIGDLDVTDQIRNPEISQKASQFSTLEAVRKTLIERQRLLAREANIVMEGRDIGTVVFPDASLKFFLIARPDIRAYRRFLELKARGEQVTEDQVLEEQAERDQRDSDRELSPLRPADDAHVIDTSNLNQTEVVARLLAYCNGGVK